MPLALSLLLSAFALLQEPVEDEQGRFSVELAVGAEGAGLEVESPGEGRIHVWATADGFVPALSVVDGGFELYEDSGSGGGETAYLDVPVVPAEGLRLFVEGAGGEGTGRAQLTWVFSPAGGELDAVTLEVFEHFQAAFAGFEGGDSAAAERAIRAGVERLAAEDPHHQRDVNGLLLSKMGLLAKKLGRDALAREALTLGHAIQRRYRPASHPDRLESASELGILLREAGDFDGARALQEEVLAAIRAAYPPDHPQLLRAVTDVAGTLREAGELEEALALLEPAHATAMETLDPQSGTLLTIKGWLGSVLSDLGRLERSLVLKEEVVAGCRERYPPGHPTRLSAQSSLAGALLEVGELDRALALQEETLVEAEAHLHAEHPTLISIRRTLAVLRSERGDREGAREQYELALAAAERTFPPDHPTVLGARSGLATALGEVGELDRSIALREEIVAAYAESLSDDHPDLVMARHNLALELHVKGEIARALALQEQVLAARERRLPEDHPYLLTARGNLALTLGDIGETERARELLESVAAIRSRKLDPDHPELLNSLANLSNALASAGDLEGARLLQERVLEARERTLPPDHPDIAVVRSSLANTMIDLGDRRGARELQELALASFERAYPPTHPKVQAARSNLAGNLSRLGEEERALALFDEALRLTEQGYSSDHPNLLAMRASRAVMLQEAGRLEEALELQRATLADFERVLPGDSRAILMHQSLAVTLRLLGRSAEAREQAFLSLQGQEKLLPEGHPLLTGARRAVLFDLVEAGELERAGEGLGPYLEGLERHLESLSLLAPREARAAVRAHRTDLAWAVSLAEILGREPAVEARLFALIEGWRRLALARGAPADGAAAMELTALRAEQAQRRAAINELVAGGRPEGMDSEAYLAELARLSLERDRGERKLRAALGGEGQAVGSLDPVRLAAALESRSVAIGFRILAHHRLEGEPPTVTNVGDRVLAHVVHPGGRLRRIDLGDADELEDLVERWRAELGSGPGRGQGLAAPALDSGTGAVLAERLLAPLLAAVGGETTRLHLCLDDFLFLLPIDALPWEDGRLGDRFRVVNEPSFARLLQGRREARSAGLLALGGADFETDTPGLAEVGELAAAFPRSEQRGAGGLQFPSLAHTLPEVRAVAALHGERFGEAAARDGAVLLEGSFATREAFRAEAPGKRFLHLATHGWFSPKLVSASMELEDDFDSMKRLANLSPGILCGLAFAGANRGRDSLGRATGIVTAEELTGLDLSACELAVLSACETSLGMRGAGQGVESLQTALLAAGARTTITSLWRVDDAATRKLFERFYTYLWVDGLSKADALWKAKTSLREEGHPVRDWAAWVLSGDPE